MAQKEFVLLVGNADENGNYYVKPQTAAIFTLWQHLP